MSSLEFDRREKWVQEMVRCRYQPCRGFQVSPIYKDRLVIGVRITKGSVLYARCLMYPNQNEVIA